MTTIKTRFSTRILLAICLAFWASACAAANDAELPADESSTLAPTSVEDRDDGSVVFHYELDEESMAAENESALDSESDVSIQRNCVYIEHCRSPSTGGIVCRSRTCGCNAQQAFDECVRDARAVCGHANAITSHLCVNG